MPSLRSHIVKMLLKHHLLKGASTLEKRRELMDKNARRFKNAAGVLKQEVKVNGRAAEWLIPENAQPNCAVLYLHGGAYVVGSLDSHRGLASHIAKSSGVRVLLLDYRLAPEHPFPAALNDAVAAFTWIQQDLGIPADRIVIAGDSAGGGLTLATALQLRNFDLSLPRALVTMSPWTDLTFSGKSIEQLRHKDPFFPTNEDLDRLREAARGYAADSPPDHPLISPLSADLYRTPDLYIQVGSDEILLSDSINLATAARKAGVAVTLEEWPGMWHVWQALYDWMPESKEAINRIGAYISTALTHPSTNSD